MSGPKCGHVAIRDRQRLERERRQREESEAKELAQLERRAGREQRDERRLAELREKETRRRERDALRAAERARLAEQQRLQEAAAYQRARATFEVALSRRADLLGRFDGLQLPDAPEIVESAQRDAKSTRAATDELLRSARAYQDAVDRALITWHRSHEAAASSEKAGALAARFRTRAVRTAKDVISALDVDRPAAQAALRDAHLTIRAQRARDLVAGFGAGMAWQDEFEMSENSLAVLEEVLSATADSIAQTAMFRLRNGLAADAKQAEQVHKTAEAKRAEDRLAEERGAQQRDREVIASTIRDTLQDLGYTVGDIDETAFVKNGTLYFSRSGWANHAVQMRLDEDLSVRVEPLRVAAEGESLGQADIANQRSADLAFDQHWCNTEGLGKLKNDLGERGLSMPLRAERTAPGEAMRRVTDAQAGHALRKAKGHVADEDPLKVRTLPHSP